MSKIIWKNLCFPSFIKCLPTTQASPDQPSKQSHHPNFNTLYDFNLINSSSDQYSTSKFLTSSSSADEYFYSSSSGSDTDQSPPNFATLLASQRFFFSSPGRSNSIIESPDTTTTTRPKSQKRMLVTKGVRVPKYSSNPYLDFRRSMEEMLEANTDHRGTTSTRDDMEYLHELLLCYLSLNPKYAHKDIMSAFTDLVISLLSAPSSSPPADTSATDHRQEDHQLEINHQLQS